VDVLPRIVHGPKVLLPICAEFLPILFRYRGVKWNSLLILALMGEVQFKPLKKRKDVMGQPNSIGHGNALHRYISPPQGRQKRSRGRGGMTGDVFMAIRMIRCTTRTRRRRGRGGKRRVGRIRDRRCDSGARERGTRGHTNWNGRGRQRGRRRRRRRDGQQPIPAFQCHRHDAMKNV